MKKLYFFIIILLALSKMSLTMESRDLVSAYCDAIEGGRMTTDITLLNKLLKMCVKLGCSKYTEMLLRKGANPNLFYKRFVRKQFNGETYFEYLNLVNCSLLNFSSDRNNQNHLRCLELLLNAKADPNVCSSLRLVPKTIPFFMFSYPPFDVTHKVCSLLLEAKADPNCKVEEGKKESVLQGMTFYYKEEDKLCLEKLFKQYQYDPQGKKDL